MSFPSRSPPTVLNMNAARPRKTMPSVCPVKKVSALAVAPTVTPKKTVTMLISAFCTVEERRSTTPDSLKRLPSISMPISGATDGSNSTQKTVTMIGKQIFSSLETSRIWSITTSRSFFVVSARISGG